MLRRSFASQPVAPTTLTTSNDTSGAGLTSSASGLSISGTPAGSPAQKAKIQAWLRDFETNIPRAVVPLDKSVFGAPIRVDILHRVVCYERDAKRQGTHSTRGISDVRGTTRKWAPQKGRGKARVGTHRAPHWKGGAVAHGPKPRSHATEIQRKVWLMGLRSALSAKYAQDQLVIVDDLNLETHKTHELYSILRANQWINPDNEASSGRVLFLPRLDFPKSAENEAATPDYRNLILASGNLSGVSLMPVEDAEVYEILKHEYLIIDRFALDFLQRKLYAC
ncbi:54S ribosomal protein yml6, mitochondrial [Spiromyces aspiralis]|uniref:54S ribosomal protein yml6, mitochondrial n=1 Tax=Spiromyces aspiralis TaxID=68401 RepID=A0ACC1HJ55_9FUNG|nr:54S ribosomal protein yml6, mitochondrial [Spiromyces aspiralis]